MIKIEKKHYKNFYEIFKEIGSYTFFLSALDGVVKGELYSDDPIHPSYALMLTADLNYLVGDFSSEEVKQELFLLSQSEDFLMHTGFIFNERHKDLVADIFKEHTYGFTHRSNYQLKVSGFMPYETDLDMQIIMITPENIKEFTSYDNYQEVYDECMFYWNEYPPQSKIRFANIMVKDNLIIGYCYICGASISENSAELGIETFEGFKRKGYGALLSRKTVKDLIALNYELFNWHCHTSNIGSSKTAEKVGFTFKEESYLAWYKKILD